MWVRLVVPTSTKRQPERDIMSGIRNEPPISISSPRETGTSFRRARVFRTSITAAALLLTNVALKELNELFDQELVIGNDPISIKKRLAFEIVKDFFGLREANNAQNQFESNRSQISVLLASFSLTV